MAVYTEVGDDELAAFLGDYAIGGLVAFKGIAEGVENSNFLLETTEGRYILTLYEKRVAEGDLPFFLGLMDHLAARGVACPVPIHGRDGRALRRLAGRPAAIISFLKGVWPRRPNARHCAEVGRGMALFHVAGEGFAMTRPNALSLAGWRPLVEACLARADTVQAGLGARISGALADLEADWPAGLPSGVIHADLFPDNVFFLDEKLSGFIDFYFACNDAYAYDLAVVINAWCFEPDGAFNATKGRNLITAYEKVRPLSVAEREALPRLATGAALRFLLTRLYDWLNQVPGAMVRPKDPLEYAQKLRFHQNVRSFRDYGID